MNTFTQASSELRIRMIEDMRMRTIELRTREGHIGLMIGVATTIGAIFWHRRWLG
jgi:hypothetical protein